jgi:hypothetical protein|tara:strand:+ start:6881 stop:7216 length:336 start_codon:yes stop_codon:yes gene_type:complete
MTDESQELEQVELLKELVGEVRNMRQRIESLESENANLRKSVDDPERMMKQAGWLKFETPHASETFDPLHRTASDDSQFSTPFQGSGDLFLKSRDEQLRGWEDAERQVKSQ